MPDIKTMTLREKIAQLIIVKQSDLMQDPDTAYDSLRDPEDAIRMVKENQYGGIWLHGTLDVNHVNADFYKENV